MACIITYNNKKYTQPEFNEYFKSHFFEFAGDFLGSKADIQGFKEFLNQNKELETDNIKSELGKNFPEKITEQELNEIKNIILNKNNNNSNIVYILFDIKEISPNLYTWDLRKIKANTTTKTILNDSLEKLLDELKNFNSNIRNNLKKDYIFNTDLFKEMIDIFDNRDFIEGAYYNYYKHKQLQDIGTFEEYVIYLKNKTDENILFKGFRNKSGYVHNTPNHSFYTPDRFIAEKFYLDEKGIKSYIIPKTIDSENKSANFKNDENLGYSVIRKNEEDFINNNGFKIIKLYTNDLGGDQIQYAVKKDFNLLELGSKKDIIEFTNFINNYRNNKELFYNFNFENINPFKC